MEEIEIRLLRQSDIGSVNDLYNRSYGIVRSREKFDWEYLQGPAGPSIYVVAIDSRSGSVVGTQCAIPLYVIDSHGKRILTAKSEDTLVDPNFRGKNIFEKMYALLFDECRKAGIAALWGFTYATKPFLRIGFDVPFACNFGLIAFNPGNAFRYLDSLKADRSALEKMKIVVLVAVSKVKRIISGSTSIIKGYHITSDVLLDLTNETIRQSNAFGLLKDSGFLNWRLRTNPYPNEHLYYSLIDDQGNRSASMICSLSNGVAYIMYLYFSNDLDPNHRQRFTLAVITSLSKKADVVRFWGFDHNETGRNEIDILDKSGFFFTGQGISFVWKDLETTTSLKPADFVLSRLAAQGT